MHISIDGSNFSGKSTLAEGLKDRLTGLGIPCQINKGTSSTSTLGRLIHDPSREYKANPLANALLIAAEKYHEHDQVLIEIIDSGKIVLTDRYLLTCLSYAVLYDISLDYVWGLYEFLPRPAVNFYINTPLAELDLRQRSARSLSFSERTFSREAERMSFQTALEYAEARGFYILQLDGSLSKGELVHTAFEHIISVRGDHAS